jgi:hypothetical protein
MKKGNYKLGSHHDLDSNILLPAMYRIVRGGRLRVGKKRKET